MHVAPRIRIVFQKSGCYMKPRTRTRHFRQQNTARAIQKQKGAAINILVHLWYRLTKILNHNTSSSSYMNIVILIPKAAVEKFPMVYTQYIRRPNYQGWVCCILRASAHSPADLQCVWESCKVTDTRKPHPA